MKKRILSAGASLLPLYGTVSCSGVSEYVVAIADSSTGGMAASLRYALRAVRTLIGEVFDRVIGTFSSAVMGAADGGSHALHIGRTAALAAKQACEAPQVPVCSVRRVILGDGGFEKACLTDINSQEI